MVADELPAPVEYCKCGELEFVHVVAYVLVFVVLVGQPEAAAVRSSVIIVKVNFGACMSAICRRATVLAWLTTGSQLGRVTLWESRGHADSHGVRFHRLQQPTSSHITTLIVNCSKCFGLAVSPRMSLRDPRSAAS